jgi:hypothetical protein
VERENPVDIGDKEGGVSTFYIVIAKVELALIEAELDVELIYIYTLS